MKHPWKPKFLIGTLFSGENELEQNKKSLREQTYDHWDQFILKNRPKKKAFLELFEKFLEHRDEYDFFIQYDADMVFRQKDALEIIIDQFESFEQVDRLEFLVKDHLTDSLIMGLNIWRSDVKWELVPQKTFYDPNHVSSIKKVNVKESPAPIVDHCPNPSDFQAFQAGVHRGIKAMQPHHKWKEFNLKKSIKYWRHIDMIVKKWKEQTNEQNLYRAYAILGFQTVLFHWIRSSPGTYDQDHLFDYFKPYENISVKQAREKISDRWDDPVVKSFLNETKLFNLAWHVKNFFLHLVNA